VKRGIKWLKSVVASAASSYEVTLHFEFYILNFAFHNRDFAGLKGKSIRSIDKTLVVAMCCTFLLWLS
jgi:hypothetical protein